MSLVLIVESDPQTSLEMAACLEKKGFAVAWARTIREAFEFLRERQPERVILNLCFDDLEGLETFCCCSPWLPPTVYHCPGTWRPFNIFTPPGMKVIRTTDLLKCLSAPNGTHSHGIPKRALDALLPELAC